MKIFIAILIFFCMKTSVTSVFSQTLPEILSTQNYQAGIYQTYAEFLKNAPSITENFQVKPVSGEKKLQKGVGTFRLVLLDSAITRRESLNFWGVCDGGSIYVNQMMYGRGSGYKKFHLLGRYCYLRVSPAYNPTPIYGGGAVAGAVAGAAALALTEDQLFIMNINNGKFFLLDKDLLRFILRRDEELLHRYEEEKRPNTREVLISYIEQYNLRHADEAFVEVLTPIEVIMFRRGIPNNEQGFVVAVNDTLKFAVNEGSVHKFQISTDTISVCIDGYCEKIKLIKNKTNFLQFTRSRNMPRVKLVDRKDGEDLVNDIENRQRRRKGG